MSGLTLMSAKLQYPVLSWLQFSVEMPVVVLDPDRREAATGAGDVIVGGRRLGFDPASASAPFVATLVDVTGLVIYFGVAYLILRGTLL